MAQILRGITITRKEELSTVHCLPGSASRGTARRLPPSVPAAVPLLLRPRLLGCRCHAGRPWLPPGCCMAGASSPRLRGVIEPSEREAEGSRSEELWPRCSVGGLVTSCSVRSFLPSCGDKQDAHMATSESGVYSS